MGKTEFTYSLSKLEVPDGLRVITWPKHHVGSRTKKFAYQTVWRQLPCLTTPAGETRTNFYSLTFLHFGSLWFYRDDRFKIIRATAPSLDARGTLFLVGTKTSNAKLETTARTYSHASKILGGIHSCLLFPLVPQHEVKSVDLQGIPKKIWYLHH